MNSRVQHAGARTPEELETLLEDALLVRDIQAVADLFEEGAVLITGDGARAVGSHDIVRLALARSNGNHSYVADPLDVCQARDIALIVAEGAINVIHRSSDGTWRYAIVRLSRNEENTGDTDDT